jgi:glycosyltransferase involved in cell wall biosynthesis
MTSSLTPKQFYVVIPCYNCEEYIGECLESLQKQTFGDWIALVADDCSTDNTAEVVRSHMKNDDRIQLRVGDERDWLMGNTLNGLRTLEMFPSDVVAILDGDDWLLETCLEKVWAAHNSGYDFVYTDEEIDGQNHSIAGPLIASAPVRRQSWRFSQLRSFKRYLFDMLEDETFLDRDGNYFRAAGDLALYMPMAELVGPEKIHFIPELLYHYRVHESCNFKVMRDEQLRNNWDIRNRSALMRQTTHFDFVERVDDMEKGDILTVFEELRAQHPYPFTIKIEHRITADQVDSWRPYHGLWIAEGVYFDKKIQD